MSFAVLFFSLHNTAKYYAIYLFICNQCGKKPLLRTKFPFLVGIFSSFIWCRRFIYYRQFDLHFFRFADFFRLIFNSCHLLNLKSACVAKVENRLFAGGWIGKRAKTNRRMTLLVINSYLLEFNYNWRNVLTCSFCSLHNLLHTRASIQSNFPPFNAIQCGWITNNKLARTMWKFQWSKYFRIQQCDFYINLSAKF